MTNSGGGTAITAAVLSIVGGAWHLQQTIGAGAGLVVFHDVLDSPDWMRWLDVANLIAAAFAAATLTAGGALLLARKVLSRNLIAAGCGAAVLLACISVGTLMQMFGTFEAVDDIVGGHASPEAFFSALSSLGIVAYGVAQSAFPIVTTVLAYRDSTLRWIYAPTTAC